MKITLLVVVAAAALTLAGCGRDAPDGARGPVEIDMTQHDNGAWTIEYDYAAPVREIDFGPSLGDYRARMWRADNGVFVVESGRDIFRLLNDARAEAVTFTATPGLADISKGYQPFAPMGEGAVLIYTGHIIPFTEGRRMRATLSIEPAGANHVAAFGVRDDGFANWESPYRHPAFIYAGAGQAEDNGAYALTAAEATPDWITQETSRLAPRLVEGFTAVFARALPTEPELYLTWRGADEPGRLFYKGDALPGQVLISLAGGGWRDDSAKAREIFQRATAHETAHLWQVEARPVSDAVPNWIHEGGADALAAEAMVAAGLWDGADQRRDFTAARAACARATAGRTLLAAEAAGDWRAAYACGHVLTVIAAGEAGPGAFWRELVRRAATNGGYDERLFLELAGETVGEAAAGAIALATRTAEARPDLALDRLAELAAAGDKPGD
ncbi:MAG: hypothetical protein R3C40_09110 [Parvularculaceae bacterium]